MAPDSMGAGGGGRLSSFVPSMVVLYTTEVRSGNILPHKQPSTSVIIYPALFATYDMGDGHYYMISSNDGAG